MRTGKFAYNDKLFMNNHPERGTVQVPRDEYMQAVLQGLQQENGMLRYWSDEQIENRLKAS